MVKIKLWGNFFLHKSQKIYHHIAYLCIHIVYIIFHTIFNQRRQKRPGREPFWSNFLFSFHRANICMNERIRSRKTRGNNTSWPHQLGNKFSKDRYIISLENWETFFNFTYLPINCLITIQTKYNVKLFLISQLEFAKIVQPNSW